MVHGSLRHGVRLLALFAAAFGGALWWAAPREHATLALPSETPPMRVVSRVETAPVPRGQDPGRSSISVAPPDSAVLMTDPARRDLEQLALTAEEGEDRAAALSQLAHQSVAGRVAVLEQVLRSDPDPRNRVMAIRLLADAPDREAEARAIVRVLQDFTADENAYVARAARDAVDAMSY